MKKITNVKIAKGNDIIQADGDVTIFNGDVTLFNNPEIGFIFTKNNDITIESYFDGRDNEKDTVTNKISKNPLKKILVTGVGGIGKTHFCRYVFNHYLKLNRENNSSTFKHIGYLTYTGNFDQTMVNGVIYEKSDDYKENLRRAWSVLENISKENSLLFIDNVDKYFHEDSSLQKLNELPCNIIVSSRFNTFSGFEPFIMEPLKIDYCKKIFTAICPHANNSEQNELLGQILESRAARHTYTIELLAKICNSHDWTLDELEAKLNSENFKLTYDDHGMIRSLEQEYKKLFKISKLNNSEISILEAFSLLPYRPLNSQLCYKLLKDDAEIKENTTILNSLYEKGWILKKNRSYIMHPIISEVIRNIQNITICKHINFISTGIKLSKIDDNDYRRTLTVASTLLPFLESVADKFYRHNRYSLEIADLYKCVGKIYYNIKDYYSAIHSYILSKNIYKKKNGKDCYDYLDIYNDIAHSYEKTSKLKRAQYLFELIIPLMKNNKNIHEKDLNVTINNLCVVYQITDNLAPMYYNITSTIRSWKRIDVINFNTAASYSIMASYFYKKKQFRAAIRNVRKAIEIGNSINPDNIKMSTFYTDLATYYSELGNNRKAIKFYLLAEEIFKSYAQEHSYHGLILLFNMGYTYMLMKQYKKANKYFIETAYWQFKTFGREHFFSKRILKYLKVNYKKFYGAETYNDSEYNKWLAENLINYHHSVTNSSNNV